MRILQVNKYHFPLGGAEKYYLDLSKLLEEKGHKIANFSMQDERNLSSEWQKYFVSNILFDDTSLARAPKTFARMVYSLEARKKMNLLLDEFVPDIVHIHNIYNHISPSILTEINKRNIPIIQTVHDYHLISPNVNLFHKGSICEKSRVYEVLLHKCIKDSYLVSGATALVFAMHKFFKIYSENIDLFIAPSLFMKKKMVEYGFNPRKIVYLPNFVEVGKHKNGYAKNPYVFYFGRLLEHKGVRLALETAELLSDVKFKIAGDGPEEKNLRYFVKHWKLANVEFLGRLTSSQILKAISASTFCILPSLWYENMPYSILESFAYGKPVIASRIGGIPEIINDGENGTLFEPGNVDELSKKIKKLWENPKLVVRMGRKARSLVKLRYNSEKHYKKLISVYEKAIKDRKI